MPDNKPKMIMSSPYLYEDFDLTRNPDFLGRMSATGKPVYRSEVEAELRMDKLLDEERKKAKAAEKAESNVEEVRAIVSQLRKYTPEEQVRLKEMRQRGVKNMQAPVSQLRKYTPEERMRVKEMLKKYRGSPALQE